MAKPKHITSNSTTWWLDSLFLCLTLGGLFFILLGSRPLFVPDEGRYAEIAREMVASGNYITPYLNEIKYFEKPILFYWLCAAAIKIGGLNLWSIRAVNALLALIGCWFTYFTGRKLFGRATGLLSALILATSTLYFVMAHMISLDLPVTVFLAISLYSFILGTQTSNGRSSRYYFWGSAASAGLAVLTKGLIGIVFPVLIIGLWIAYLNQWKRIKQLPLFSCFIIFLLITVPWHYLANLYNPEFFYFYFIEQHFLRYTLPEIGHYQPVWFFLPILIIGFFPWVVFLLQAMASVIKKSWRERQKHQSELFFLIWIITIFVFFSFSKSKLIPYILPIFPPLAMLIAHYLAGYLDQTRKSIIRGYVCLFIFSCVIAFGFYQLIQHAKLPDPAQAKCYLSLAGGLLCVGNLFGLFFAFKNTRYAIISTIATTWLFLMMLLAAAPAIDTRSILSIAETIKHSSTPDIEVLTYKQYYQDLPFYLERRVTIVNWKNELTYGMKHQNTQEWMIDKKTFWERWNSNQHIFVVISHDELQNLIRKFPNFRFYVIKDTINNTLISNRKTKP